ncbi:MAG: hypothetical protein J7485_09425 [Sphingobium sp.]|nr:hypothetical protein [Sphingobium sp.]
MLDMRVPDVSQLNAWQLLGRRIQATNGGNESENGRYLEANFGKVAIA